MDTEAVSAGTCVGRYIVLRKLGTGGMGVVYAAHDPELDRNVALKLIRPDLDLGADATSWILRESQALAKLQHPNVIAVYDAGVYEDQVFMTMELVVGQTLRRWLASGERTWREIVHVFLEAGHGLAAAHAAGLVHGDVKPDNLLVSQAGRVYVSDFSLARVVGAQGSVDSPPATPLDAEAVVAGTPGYMAPEVVSPHVADPKSDQFGFAVALYEALAGVHPFGGKAAPSGGPTRQTKPHPSANGPEDVAAPVDGVRVPARLLRVARRGMALRPEDRYPSMHALLAELAADPAPRRRVMAAAAAALAIAVAAWMLGRRTPHAEAGPVCRGAGGEATAMWSPATREQARGAFARTGLKWAARSFALVDEAFGRFGADWARAATDACEATRVRRTQTEAVLDLRQACLARRLKQAQAIADVVVAADRAVVEQATRIAGALRGGLDECADVDALVTAAPPPADAKIKADVEQVRGELARNHATLLAGRYEAAVAAARKLDGRAAELGYAPLRAETAFALGEMLTMGGDPKQTQAALKDAIVAAELGRADALRAAALLAMVQVLAWEKKNVEEAELWAALATAAVDRAGRKKNAAMLESSLGQLDYTAGRYEQAATHELEALRLRAAELGEDDVSVAYLHSNHGSTLIDLGRFDEAERHLERARSIIAAKLGSDNPLLSYPMHNLGLLYVIQGRYAEALAIADQELALTEQTLGPEASDTATAVAQKADVLVHLGRLAEGKALAQRASGLFVKLGDESPDSTAADSTVGIATMKEGRLDEALRIHQAVLKKVTAAYGDDHVFTAGRKEFVADVLVLKKDYAGAEALYTAALAVYAEKWPKTSMQRWAALLGLAKAELGLGKRSEALAHAREALALVDGGKLRDADAVADVRATVARAQGEEPQLAKGRP